MRHSSLLVLCCIMACCYSLSVSDFNIGIFQQSQSPGFWPVYTGDFNSNGQIITAYADFNSDKFTDMVTIDNTQTGIQLYLWNNKASMFTAVGMNTTQNMIIVSTIPADYNSDGDMDLLIVYSSSLNNITSYEIQIQINKNCDQTTCTFSTSDYNSDYFTELDPVQPFLINPSGTSDYKIVYQQNGIRYVLTPAGDLYTQSQFSQLVVDSTNMKFPVLANHYASIIDYNGDCQSDLILISNASGTQYLQFYRNMGSKYNLDKNITLPYFVNKISFADINYDGTTDMVMIILDNNSNYQLQINYNKYVNSKICSAFDGFPYDINFNNSVYQYIQRLTLPYPIVNITNLNFGDVNTDGFPDLVVVLNDSNANKAFLLYNVGCSGTGCGAQNHQFLSSYTNLRNFNFDTSANIIKQSAYATSVSLFDLGEDGRLDILINSVNIGTNGVTKNSIVPIYNNLNLDSFFIKALPATKYSSDDDNKIVNDIGITFQWKITTLQGNYKNSIANQLFQQTNRALQLPFISIGLGRTNNYLEDFTVGYPGQNNLQTWSPVIPNSQLIVIPSGAPSDWTLGIYVSRTERINQVIFITIVILVVLGIYVIYLNYKQAEEDKKNQFMFFQLIR